MISFQCSFLSNEITRRAIIFSFSIAIIISLCAYHGILGRVKTIDLIDQMIVNGNLTGKFWRVIKAQDDQITITKYQRTITLSVHPQKRIRAGDKVSFVAKLGNAQDHLGASWYAIILRIHGTSSFKFILSFVSVMIVIVMFLRHFRFHK